MRPSIFISRDVSRAQDFINLVDPVSSSVTCVSLIDFSIVVGGSLPKNGWIFFYSQTGVDFFLKQYQIDEIKSNKLKVAAFGPKTGQYLSEQGILVDFVGTGESNTTGDLFLHNYQSSNVCFIKGSSSKDSLKPILESKTSITEITVYSNEGKRALELTPSDILVFTSPLNLETYDRLCPIQAYQKVVVIGTTTAMSALNIGITEVHISPKPSLESLALLVVELCDTWFSMK